MKIIRNKIVITLLAVLLSLSVFLLVLNFEQKSANAEVTPITECEDRFSDDEISKNWTLVNKTETDVEFLDLQYNAMVFAADFNTFLSQVNYKPYCMTGPCRVEFTTLCEESNNGYVAFSAGNENPSLGMPYASAAFIMFPTYAHIFANDGGVISVVEEHVQYFSPMMEKYFGELIKTTFDFQATDKEGFYDIVYTVETVYGEKIGSYVYTDTYIRDGYFGFNSQYSRLGVTSFKVYEGLEEKVNCDFSNSSILYPTSGSNSSDWVACSFDTSSLKIGTMSTLDVSKVGTSAVYATKYERPVTTELEELYSISAEVKTADMGIGVATGFEIGKTTTESDGIFAGLTKDNSGKYYLVSFDGSTQNRVVVDEFKVDGLTMKLEVFYDNTAVISIGSASLKFDCKVVEGYFALTTVDFYDAFEGEKGAKLDNFIYIRNSYKNTQSNDVGINFEGVKQTYFESLDLYANSYYINKKEWNYSETGILIPEYVEGVDNNAITFTGFKTAPIAYFGPNAKYTNFIVRFDITMLKDATVDSQPTIGLQFGMASKDSTIAQSYFLGFISTPIMELDAEDNIIYKPYSYITSQSAKLTTGNNNEPVSNDPFSLKKENIFKRGKTYNVMYVAENGSIKFYFKEASEPESALEVLRAEMKDINTQGYLQVYSTYASFNLDNLSVTNLDYNITSTKYNGNGYEMIRSDFAMADSLSGFTLNDAENKDTTLFINEGGSIVSNSKIKNNIFRFKTKTTDGDVVFEQGGLKVIFAKTGDKLLIANNKKVKEFILEEKIDFDGALFEIYKMGNSVVVSYVNKEKPTACIRNNQYEIIAENNFEDNIKLYSKDGDLELYTVSLFDLKTKITISTRNYDVSLDYTNPWPERPSIQDANGSGCSGNVDSTIIVVPFVMALALAILIVRRKKDEKNK